MEPFWENIFRKDSKEKAIETALKNNVLFQNLGARDIAFVQKLVNVRSFAPGESIFQQGEIGVGMYIILRGGVDIIIEDSTAAVTNETTEPHLVTRLTEGDFLGELALIEESGRRTATAKAREESVLIGFFKPDLMEIVNRNPTAGVKILLNLSRILGNRLIETTAIVRHLRLQAGLNR